jgi:hypothetical protein
MMGSSSSIVVTIGSLQELVPIVANYTSELLKNINLNEFDSESVILVALKM